MRCAIAVLAVLVALSAVAPSVRAGCTLGPAQCYVDTQSRILGHDNENPYTDNSNEWCAQICSDQRYTLAGTENGNECYCGNSVASGAKKQDSSHCGTACTGHDSENCGGVWAISIFSFNCSGTPVPPPPPPPPRLVNPCLNTSVPYYKMPFCDPTLPIDTRVKDAISRMTLAEKIANLGTAGGDIAGLGIPAYNWWSEATHGVASARTDPRTAGFTNYAFPITTGMSYNKTLWFKTGSQIGREARALMNNGDAYSTFWAPVINLAREPRWARNIETPGEDPYLSGQYAVNFVKGFQEAPEDETHVQASACCKHYVANSMDGTTQQGVHWSRQTYDANITMQDLVDSYMLPFQYCVEVGRVTGLMCSYNAVNGIPTCANPWLGETVARGEWEFDGYITSDCDADSNVYNTHHYASTPEEAVRDVFRAGTDVDCVSFVPQHAQSALDQGLITVADIDARLEMLFRVRFRLSHFDPAGPLQQIPLSTVCSQYALDLARDGTAQASVLIKNDNSRLPLKASAIPSVAVIGPNANLSQSVAGYYGPRDTCYGKFWNVVDGVAEYVSNTVSASGVPSVSSNDPSQIPAAVALAKQVDTVILVVGTDLSWAAEGHDATSIVFSDGQKWLIGNVTAAAKKPVVVVTLTATPLDLTDLLSNDKVGAIVHAGQPSVTAPGVADVLFGKKPPAGRTIQTILPASYADEVSIFDFNMRPGPSPFPRPDCTQPYNQCPNGTNPGRTHRFYTGKPVIPFGFGLSYTTWKYTPVGPSEVVSLDAVRTLLTKTREAGRTFPSLHDVHAETPVSYNINVTNTGSIDSDHVVLGIVVPPNAGQNGVPLESLFGFERVHVPAGQTVTVNLYPALTDFTHVNANGDRIVLTGEYTFRFGIPELEKYEQGFAEHKVTVI